MSQLALIRQLRRVHRNLLITCAIVAPLAAAIAVNVSLDHPSTGGFIAIIICGVVALGCGYAFVKGLFEPIEKRGLIGMDSLAGDRQGQELSAVDFPGGASRLAILFELSFQGPDGQRGVDLQHGPTQIRATQWHVQSSRSR